MTDPRPVVIEKVSPEVDGGRFPIKREVGDTLDVWADIFADGHGLLAAAVKYRPHNHTEWAENAMTLIDNDRWHGSFLLERNTRYVFALEAWRDVFGSWRRDLERRAGEDLGPELQEGRRLIKEAAARADGDDQACLTQFLDSLRTAEDERTVFLNEKLREVMARHPDRSQSTVFPRREVTVDRPQARFAAWYEMFPRSAGGFRQAQGRLKAIKTMGFDVVYLPPVHPIGRTGRKGPNNSLEVKPGDPGSPWAIGNEAGGHKAVDPALGSIDDFDDFVAEAGRLGMEIALDYAIQCSPDHPYVKEHPDWFYRRPDGSIRYAENPPKKYQDIYPVNFYCDDRRALWDELKSIVLFWIDHGVRTFRVDNPHTKPFPFWEWLIAEIQRQHPDVIFLAEAFTRPKVMKYLAKVGFSQSYTYFTWRNTAAELRDYLTELTQSEAAEYLRGNLFANTPDILHEYLQTGGRAAFQVRLVLAATLSSVYGIYNGFELLEASPLHPGSEEYLNSEKYQIRQWDWDRPGNLMDYIAQVNLIRQQNAALHYYKNLRFQSSDSDRILAYAKHSDSSIIFAVVNVDPFAPHEAAVQAPLDWLQIAEDQAYQAEELLTHQSHTWTGSWQHLRLDPAFNPAAIYRLTRR